MPGDGRARVDTVPISVVAVIGLVYVGHIALTIRPENPPFEARIHESDLRERERSTV